MTLSNTFTHARVRSLGLSALWGMLVFSLVYSLSIKAGHADVSVAATAAEITPLDAGDAAPYFVVRTPAGDTFAFDPQNLQRPAIIINFRGGWCPYCNMHLSELHEVIPQISKLDVDVLFLSGDRPGQLYTSLKVETQEDIAGLGYSLYSDADANAAIAFGIAFRASDRTINRRHDKAQDIAGSSMMTHGVLPVPAVFAIDKDGIIRFAYANPDYKVRVSADELLELAESMAGP